MTPSKVVAYLRSNQNNNKTLKSLFSKQLLGKLSQEELDGLARSIQKETTRRAEAVIQEKIDFLTEQGYTVHK